MLSQQVRSEANDTSLEFGVARGIDFKGVAFVLNVDFPTSNTSYTHRIGRTARGGSCGTALSFVNINDEHERKVWDSIIQVQRKISVGRF